MLTIEQKAAAWDGMKEALLEMKLSPDVSTECSRMSGEFLQLMRQAESSMASQNRVSG